jgi:hypothetical protein
MPLTVGLDRRAPFTVADRKIQHAEAMKASALFGRMSDSVDRLNGLKALAGARADATSDDALKKDIGGFVEKSESIRKKMVATTEGGAITGEERLREHLDNAYGALTFFEGRPGPYQIERVAVLDRELKEVEAEVASLLATDLPALNDKLKAKGLEPIVLAAADLEGARFAALKAAEGANGAPATILMRN